MLPKITDILSSTSLTAVLLFIVLAIYLSWIINPYGISNKIKIYLKIPVPAGADKPILKRSIEVKTKEASTPLGEIDIEHLYLLITNTGKESADKHIPEIWIESEGSIVYDNRGKHAEAGVSGIIHPENHVGFSILNLLSKGQLANKIKLIGLLDYILGKEFVVKTKSNYVFTQGIYKEDSSIYGFKVSWKLIDEKNQPHKVKVYVTSMFEGQHGHLKL